jgi:hypothetical protein
MKIQKLFQIINFFDNSRWSSISNYNLINFYDRNISYDSKLLTHWICYITDRQTGFERIWNVGGFIFSELVNDIKSSRNINILNPDFQDSYIKKDGDGFTFKSKSKLQHNSILENYNFKSDDLVLFKSRYYPSDYLSVFYTLVFLEKYDFNLTKFIVDFYYKYKEEGNFIKLLLFGMSLITYSEIGQPKKEIINDFHKNYNNASKRKVHLFDLINNRKKFISKFELFSKDSIFKQKRAWCSLRDFLKSPEFSNYFKNSLIEENFNDIDFFFNSALLYQLELPGDVWNNNQIFRKCILSGTKYIDNKDPLNKLLRNIYDENSIPLGYPEQFDITFDFVPRMCEKNNCEICPIGKLNGRGESFEKVCIKNPNKFCPVLLTSCGYKTMCTDDKCNLINAAITDNTT